MCEFEEKARVPNVFALVYVCYKLYVGLSVCICCIGTRLYACVRLGLCVHEYLFITGRSFCVDCVCVGNAIDRSTQFKGPVED